jgi:valyl-tRNA synthetase
VQFIKDASAAQGGEGAVELVVQDGVQVILPLKGLFDASKEVARLRKQRGKAEKELVGLEGRLKNPKFVDNAAQKVVSEACAQAEELRRQLEAVDTKIAQAEKLL